MEDKLVADTDEKKNELESSIYELRDKVETTYSDFASDEEREKLTTKLSEIEDWLYEDGEDTTKAAYVAKMDEIRFIAGPIIQRYMDKIEADRQAILKAQEEAAAKRRAEEDSKRKPEEEGKKTEEGKDSADAEMKEAPSAADGEAASAEKGEMDENE